MRNINVPKKLIEHEKSRLEELISQQYISRDQANKQLKEYAQFVCQLYKC